MPAYYVRWNTFGVDATSQADVVNTGHYEVDALSSPLDLNGVATDLWNHFGTQYLNMCSTSLVVQTLTATVEDYQGSTPGQGFHAINTAGAHAPGDHNVSRGITALIAWKSGIPKRYGHGRTWCPPPLGSNAIANEGQWNLTSSYYLAVDAYRQQYLTPFSAGSTSYTPIVFSKTRAKQNLVPFTFPILTGTISPRQHYIGRRVTVP